MLGCLQTLRGLLPVKGTNTHWPAMQQMNTQSSARGWGQIHASKARVSNNKTPRIIQHGALLPTLKAVKGEKAACCLFELELCAQEQPKDLGRLQAALDAWDSIVGAAAAGWASPNYIAVRLALRKLQKEQGAAANKQRAASAPRWKGPAAGQQVRSI
eukprot:1158318-Pelagomonas_calceolata.AAC.5